MAIFHNGDKYIAVNRGQLFKDDSVLYQGNVCRVMSVSKTRVKLYNQDFESFVKDDQFLVMTWR